jgi:hypothetical protein
VNQPYRLIPGEMAVFPNGGDISLMIEAPCTCGWRRRVSDFIRRREHPPFHYVQIGNTLAAVSGNEMTVEWDAAGNLRIKP